MSGRGVRAHIRVIAGVALGSVALAAASSPLAADTLEWALVQAYQNNPSLNAQRAALRATDENVPQALSGYRPKLSVTASGGFNYATTLSDSVTQSVFPNSVSYTDIGKDYGSRGVGATATETLYNGNQTANRTRQAESQVMGARETLRVTEQQVLLDAATSYMNLLRDGAILDLNRSNVEVLTEQLKQTRDRFNVGEVTRTDVAQAEVAIGGRAVGIARRTIELRDVAGQLSARDRRRSGQARARHAGRPLFAGIAGRRDHARPGRKARRCSPPCMASTSPNSR